MSTINVLPSKATVSVTIFCRISPLGQILRVYLANWLTLFVQFLMLLGKHALLSMAECLTNNVAIWWHCKRLAFQFQITVYNCKDGTIRCRGCITPSRLTNWLSAIGRVLTDGSLQIVRLQGEEFKAEGKCGSKSYLWYYQLHQKTIKHEKFRPSLRNYSNLFEIIVFVEKNLRRVITLFWNKSLWLDVASSSIKYKPIGVHYFREE